MSDLNWFERLILRREEMKFIRAHWAVILSILTFAGSFLYPSLDAYAKANPHTALGLILATLIGAFYDSRGKLKSSL